jgi:hypothetical protein
VSAARTRRPAALPPAAAALLVPIDVRALVFAHDSAGRAWSWGLPDYDRLRFLDRVDPEPLNDLLPEIAGRPFWGAIVHWSLPDALTSGHQDGDGPVRYPAAPNRWLVARKYPAGTEWRHRGWIVASDVSPSPTGGSPWPTQAGTQTSIGTVWPIERWPGEAALRASGAGAPPDGRPLTAVGAADPAFAAFVPNVNTVFSYADDLADLSVWGDVGPLQYTVLGWYATAQADPLLGVADYGPQGWQTEEQWRALVKGLGLTLGGDAALKRAEQAARDWAVAHGREVDDRARTRFPARTLCHGLVQGVPWNGPAGPTKDGVPTLDTELPSYVPPRVAVAHSAADALAAVYAQKRLDEGVDPRTVAQLVDVFSAFVSDLLPLLGQPEVPDALPRLAIALQKDWFGTADGGTAWAVIGAAGAGAPQGDPADPPLTDAQQVLLHGLNDAQRRADELTRAIESRQRALYGLWWKGTRLRYEPWQPDAVRQQVARAFAELKIRLAGDLEELAAARESRDAAERELRGTLDPEAAELAHGARPAFFAPTDPVVLVSGVRRGLRHGADGRLREDGELACRFTGQTVSGIAVAVPDGYAPVTSRDVPPPDWAPAVPEAPDLLAEAFFLDVDNAPWIARIAADKAGLADPWSLLHTIRTEQTVVWNGALHRAIDPAALEDDSTFLFSYGLGALPQAIGVVFYTPPWSPLFLDWQVEFFPGAAEPAGALAPWELPPDGPRDSPLDAFTYRWRSDEPPAPVTGILISGRSVLTAQATDLIAARLDKLLADFPDAPEVRDNLAELADALAYAGSADLLSQAASGLNLAMLEWSPAAFITPADGSLDPYLHPAGGPDTTPDATPNPLGALLVPRFNPIRAGHLRLAKLWVVDDFGQVYKVMDDGGALPPGFPPALPADLVTPGDDTLAALKPRVTQAARLTLDLLPAAERSAPGAGPAPDGNPVHGWLMHQLLDRALLVYTADGTYQGAVTHGTDAASWFPNPQSWRPADGPPAPDTIPDRYLRALVTGLLGRPDSNAALRSLLALIDEAAWSVEPREGFLEELPLLTGRPLAVTRARLLLAARGRPAVNQAWALSGLDVTDGFDTVPFPVQLGTTELLDDGLAGYYLDDDYSRIDTVHPVPADGYVGHRRPQVTLDGSIAPLVTMLMDPAAAVHAITGAFPVVRVELPPRFAVPALQRLAVTFRAGPLAGTAGSVAVPVPEVAKGAWSWLEYPAPDQLAVAVAPIPAPAEADLPDAYPVVREGWLRLDPDRIDQSLTFAVSPTALPTADDPGGASAASVRCTVHNDTGATVACTQVAITLPVGAGADDLTADPAPLALRAVPEADWRFSRDAPGRLVARPGSGTFRMEAGAGVLFEVAGIRVGGAPGAVAMEIAATTVPHPAGPVPAGSGPAEVTHRAVLRVEKAPARPVTALTYTAHPPAVAAGRTVALRIACFNGTGAAVTCDRIQLALPVGDGAADLTAAPGRVTATVGTPGWSVAADGHGGFVLTPSAEVSPPIGPGAAVEVDLAGIEVAAEAGFAVLAVAETIAAHSALPTAGRAAVGVRKRALP